VGGLFISYSFDPLFFGIKLASPFCFYFVNKGVLFGYLFCLLIKKYLFWIKKNKTKNGEWVKDKVDSYCKVTEKKKAK
jgi:hypothetical protein